MTYSAVGKNVLLECPADHETKTKSGIVLLSTETKKRDGVEVKPREGILRSIGSKCEFGLTVGQIVMYNPYDGYRFKDPETDISYIVVSEVGVFGVIHKQ